MNALLFGVSAHYWPAATAMYGWREYDPWQVRRDFERCADFDLDQLDIALPWEFAQPLGRSISSAALRAIETVLELAAGSGISLAITVLPVSFGSYLWLPSWLLDPLENGERPVVTETGVTQRRVVDLISDPTAVEAEVGAVRAIVGEFDAHPALARWILGEGVTFATVRRDADQYGAWLHGLVETARAAGARKPIFHGISAHDLIVSRGATPEVVADAGAQSQVVVDWRPAWASNEPGIWERFLARYAIALGGAPPWISGVRAGTTAAGGDDASAIEQRLLGVRDGGAQGISAAAVFDYDVRLASLPPFRASPDLLAGGLIDPNGQLTPSGQAWREASATGLQIVPSPSLSFVADLEDHRRDPERFARDMYNALAE